MKHIFKTYMEFSNSLINFFFYYFKDKNTDITVKDNVDDFCLRDTLSIASTDSFVSTAEVRLIKIAFFKDLLIFFNSEQKNPNFLLIIVSKNIFHLWGKRSFSRLCWNQLFCRGVFFVCWHNASSCSPEQKLLGKIDHIFMSSQLRLQQFFHHDLYFSVSFFLLLYHTIKMYEEGFILFRPGGGFFERK